MMLNPDAVICGEDGRESPQRIDAVRIQHFNRDDPALRTFGALEFRGGLVLTSPDKAFGGFSSLRIQPDGVHFLALSDRAYWLRGSIAYENESPSGIHDALIGPVGDSGGNFVPEWDTESMAFSGRRLYVGVEGLDRILCFFYDPEKLSGFPVFDQTIPFPPGLEELPINQGLEALECIPGKGDGEDTLIAFSEKGLDANGNMKAFIIEGADRKTFSVKRTLEYDITDAARLPDGDILILERKYDRSTGATMRIRRLAINAILPDTVVDGPVMMEAGVRCEIDNMEAIAAYRSASGRIVLTLLSDDNYSPAQRTLLLQFYLEK